MTQRGSTYKGPIYGSNRLFQNYSYLIGSCPKNSEETTEKKKNMNVQ